MNPPRGILHPHLSSAGFVHRRHEPSPDLAPWIEHHWFVSWDLRGLPDQVQETLPHPNIHLVAEDDQLRVWGVKQARFTKVLSGVGQAFGVKFRVGGFHAFHPCPVARLKDRNIDAAEVWRDARSLPASFPAGDDAKMRDRLEDLLRSNRPAGPDPRAETLAEIVRMIGADPAITSVDALCGITGETARQLQRDFQRYVGVSPKWVIARYRLHEAVDLLQRGAMRPDAALAQHLGYFDQAHFIRDFKRLIGVTPLSYARSIQGSCVD